MKGTAFETHAEKYSGESLKQAYEQYRKKEKYKGEQKRRAYHGTYIIEKGGKAEQILADTAQRNKGSLCDA